jgi:hypothetical protein
MGAPTPRLHVSGPFLLQDSTHNAVPGPASTPQDCKESLHSSLDGERSKMRAFLRTPYTWQCALSTRAGLNLLSLAVGRCYSSCGSSNGHKECTRPTMHRPAPPKLIEPVRPSKLPRKSRRTASIVGSTPCLNAKDHLQICPRPRTHSMNYLLMGGLPL